MAGHSPRSCKPGEPHRQDNSPSSRRLMSWRRVIGHRLACSNVSEIRALLLTLIGLSQGPTYSRDVIITLAVAGTCAVYSCKCAGQSLKPLNHEYALATLLQRCMESSSWLGEGVSGGYKPLAIPSRRKARRLRQYL